MSPKLRVTGVQVISSKKPDTYTGGVLTITGTPYTYRIGGLEELTESTGHLWPPKETSTFKDIGGDFSVRRYKTRVRPAHAWGYTTGYTSRRCQNMLLVPGNINLVQTIKSGLPSYPSDSVLNGQGAILWNRTKPTRPRGSIDQFMGELHELPRLPRLRELKDILTQIKNGSYIKASSSSAKEVSSQFLNYQFAWLPFIKDIQDLCQNALDEEKHLIQLLRDNGKPVHRKGVNSLIDSHNTVTTSLFPGGYSYPAVQTELHELPEVRTISTYTTEDYRFSARFRYWIQDPNKFLIPSREKYQLNRILYGGEINAATLYHLVPWTWLIDWFSSTGAIVDNFVNDAVDNLVADYAYVTGVKKTRTETTVTGKFHNGPPWSCFAQVISETKRRKHASPYGFGVALPSLSAKRQAILAALGLAKFL